MSGLFTLGVVFVGVGIKGFTKKGLPFTPKIRLSGTSGKTVGILCTLFGIGLMLIPFAQKALVSEFFLWEGRRAFEKGNDVAALNCFNASISERPDNPDGYFSRGKLHSKRRDFGQAIEDFTTAIQLKPETAEYYRYRAQAYRSLHDHSAADDDRKAEELSK
jgi:tetratricopeptide (TPR) repeat protein